MKSKGLLSTQALRLAAAALMLTPLACNPVVESLPISESSPAPIAIAIVGPAEVHGEFADVYGTWAGFPAAEVTIRLYAQESNHYWCIQPAAASASGDQWTAAGQFGGVTTYGVFAVVASGDGNQLPGCTGEPDQNYITAVNDDQFRATVRPYVYLGDNRSISPRFVIVRVE